MLLIHLKMWNKCTIPSLLFNYFHFSRINPYLVSKILDKMSEKYINLHKNLIVLIIGGVWNCGNYNLSVWAWETGSLSHDYLLYSVKPWLTDLWAISWKLLCFVMVSKNMLTSGETYFPGFVFMSQKCFIIKSTNHAICL